MSTSLLSCCSSLMVPGPLSATLAGTLNGNIVSVAYPALLRSGTARVCC
jgi:hypothetical protein